MVEKRAPSRGVEGLRKRACVGLKERLGTDADRAERRWHWALALGNGAVVKVGRQKEMESGWERWCI